MFETKRPLIAMGAALAIAIGLTATGTCAADKMKVGFVYVGPIGDHGWSYQPLYQGRTMC